MDSIISMQVTKGVSFDFDQGKEDVQILKSAVLRMEA